MGDEKKMFYGWWVAFAIFWVAFFGPMGRFILIAFVPFLEKEMGWSREVIGTVFALQFWVYSIISILIGRMIDTLGGRIMVFTGGVFILIGLVLLSFSRSLWHFYGSYGVILAFSVSMTHLAPNTAIIRKWFIRKAGLVTGIVIAGLGLGYGSLVPIVGALSTLIGWRSASVICGLAFGSFIMMLALLVIRSTPESVGLHPDGVALKETGPQHEISGEESDEPAQTTGQILRSRNFFAIFVSYSVTGIAFQGLLAHLIMWAIDLGADTARAGLLITALTFPSIPVRILGGWLGDRLGKKRVIISFSISCAAIYLGGWFFIDNPNSLLAFAVILGLAQSVPLPLYTPYLGDLFGRYHVGTLMGILTLGHGVIGGLGPVLWGLIVDKTGSYELACLLSAASYLICGFSLFLIRSKSSLMHPALRDKN